MAVTTIATRAVYSYAEREYRVRILYDGIYPGTPFPAYGFETTDEAVTIENDGDIREPEKPVITTKASMTIILSEPAHFDFVDQLAAAPEGAFILSVDWVNPVGGTFTNIFTGHILADTIEYSDTMQPELAINATDGIMRLKDEEFPEFASKLTLRDLATYIVMCLQRIPWVSKMIGEDDEILRANVAYYEEQLSSSDHMLHKTFVKNYFFEDNEDTGIVTYRSCYEVLEEILSVFGCNIVQNHGYYAITQRTQRTYSGSIIWDRYKNFIGSNRVHKMTPDQGSAGNLIVDISNDNNIEVAAFPLFQYLPPLRAAKIIQKGDYLDNIWDFPNYTYNIRKTSPGPFLTNEKGDEVTVSTIYETDNGTKVLMGFNWWRTVLSEEKGGIHDDMHVTIVIAVKMKVGGKYLRHKAVPSEWHSSTVDALLDTNYLNGNNVLRRLFSYDNDRHRDIVSSELEWSDNANDRLYISIGAQAFSQLLERRFARGIRIESPPLVSSGELVIDVEPVHVYEGNDIDVIWTASGQPVHPNFSEIVYYELNDMTVVIGKDLNELYDDDGIRELSLANNLDNSVDVEFEHNMGDFPGKVINQKLIVESSAGLVDSVSWNNNGTSSSIVNHLLRDTVRMRSQSQRRVEMALYLSSKSLPPSFLHVYKYKTVDYLQLRRRLVTGVDVLEISGWEIKAGPPLDTDPVVVGLPPTIISDLVSGLVIPGGDNTDPLVPELDALPPEDYISYQRYFVFLSVTDSYVHTDYLHFPNPALYTELSIDHATRVIVGSAWYSYKPAGDLGQANYKLSYVDKHIIFSKPLRSQRVSVEFDLTKLVRI